MLTNKVYVVQSYCHGCDTVKGVFTSEDAAKRSFPDCDSPSLTPTYFLTEIELDEGVDSD